MGANTEDLKFRILAEAVGGNVLTTFRNQLNGVQASASKVGDTFGELKEGVKLLAEALLIREAVMFAKSIVDIGDKLYTMSERTNVAVKDLSGFTVAADTAGLSTEGLEKSLKKFNINIAEASSGNKEISGTFKSLGISITGQDGKLKNTGDLIKELSDKFSKLKDNQLKTAAATKLFGKSGADMIPFLNQGRTELEKYSSNFSDNFAQRADAFNDTLAQIKASSQGVFAEAFEEALPTLQQLGDVLLDASKNGEGLKTVMVGITEVVRDLVIAISSLNHMLEQTGKFFGGGAASLTPYVEASGILDAVNISKAWDDYQAEFSKQTGQSGDIDWLGLKKLKSDLSKTFGLSDETQSIADSASTYVKTFKDAHEESAKIAQEWFSDAKKTGNDYLLQNDKLTRDSLIFGKGSSGEILQRQKDSTRPPEKKKIDKEYKDEEAGTTGTAINSFKEKIAKIQAEADALGLSNVQREKTILLSELESKGVLKSSAAYGTLSVSLDRALNNRERAKENEAIKEYSKNESRNIELRKLELSSLSMSSYEYQKLVESKKEEWAISDATKNMTADGAAAYRDAASAVREQKDALSELQEEQKQSYGQGAKEAIHDYVESAMNSAEQMKRVFSNAFSNMEDALVDFIKTGKMNFRDFANSVINDLLRIAVRQAILAPIAGSMMSLFDTSGGTDSGGGVDIDTRSANGDILTKDGPMKLWKYAKGGVAYKPQVSLFGEGSTPEAIIPLPDGRSVPVTLKDQNLSGQAGGVLNLSVTTNVNATTGEQSTSDNGQNMSKLGQMITNKVKEVIINERRPGGLLT